MEDKIPFIRLMPNQRGIIIKEIASVKGERFTATNYDVEQAAAFDLGISGAFIMWRYLSHNKEGYAFGLSLEALRSWGIKSKNGYASAFNTLIERGYLVPVEEDARELYYFYQIPQ